MSSAQLCTSTCPYCGVGCGVEVKRSYDQSGHTALSDLKGQIDHPANNGKLCVKGTHLLDTNDTSGRLREPEIDGQVVDWNTATSYVADKLNEAINEFGPDSVAFYVSGQLLTEDYYVANKLMKGFIGSANIDTNSRLCMSSAVAAYKRAFGSDSVPCCYEDIDYADLVVLTGSNAAWTHPVLFQRLQRAKQRNPKLKVVSIDPRKTASCEIADLHLAIKPGTDTCLFNGLLRFLHSESKVDRQYIEAHTNHFEQTLAMAQPWTLEKVATHCDCPVEQIRDFFTLFGAADAALSLYSMGVNQSSRGVDKANAIINCHLATRQLGRPGAGPFSLTGQPNAMGGREVGGLSNMLAAHMEIENPSHRQWVQTFWQSPKIPVEHGLKAVDLFDSVAMGKIKVIWIIATNPVVSMPNRNRIERALETCPCVIVSDVVSDNDTLAFASVKLPATGWSEKDGTVTNSERMISRQRGLIPPYGHSRHDWQILADVARKMGFENGFNYRSSAEIFDEHARLTAFHNDGTRDLDLSSLIGLTSKAYDQLRPIQWPVTESKPDGTKRLFTDARFYTADKRANFIPIEPCPPEQITSNDYPLILNSGRQRDQWHTMTRTGKAKRLLEHTEEPFFALNPKTAINHAVSDQQLVALTSAVNPNNPVIVRCRYDHSMRQGEGFLPIHWSLQQTNAVAITRLFTSACDPISGQPELKHAAINCEALVYPTYVRVVSRAELPLHFLQFFAYWSSKPIKDGFSYRMACQHTQADCDKHFEHLLSGQETVHRRSDAKAQFTVLLDEAERLSLFWLSSQTEQMIEEKWVEDCFSSNVIEPTVLRSLLRNQPEDHYALGPVVCSCFNVHRNTIIDQVAQGANSVEALGKALKCGTNCGSCQSELSQIIRATEDDLSGQANANSDNEIISIQEVLK